MAINAKTKPDDADEAVAWFKAKAKVGRGTWRALDAAARARAFNVAGLTSARAVDSVYKALEKAVAEGTPYKDFAKAVKADVEADWGKPNAALLETVFRNHVAASYAAGRLARLREPGALERRPFRLYSAVLDPATTPVCRSRHGVLLPADDPWWQENEAPLHHRCRAQVVSLSKALARARGGVKRPGADLPPPPDGWGSQAALLGDEPPAIDLAPPMARAVKDRKGKAPEPEADPTPPLAPREPGSTGGPERPDFPLPKVKRPAGQESAYDYKREFFSDLKRVVESSDNWDDLRRVNRRALAMLGMISSDVELDKPDAGKVFPNAPMASPDGLAFHSWDGGLHLSERISNGLRSFVAKIPADGDVSKVPRYMFSRDELRAVGVLLHEEIHGSGSPEKEFYEGLGVAIEEGTVEASARVAMRFLFGLPKGAAVPANSPFFLPRAGYQNFEHANDMGAYDVYVGSLFKAARDSGAEPGDDLTETVAAAIARTRVRSVAKVIIETPDQYLDLIAKELGLTSAAAKRKFREKFEENLERDLARYERLTAPAPGAAPERDAAPAAPAAKAKPAPEKPARRAEPVKAGHAVPYADELQFVDDVTAAVQSGNLNALRGFSRRLLAGQGLVSIDVEDHDGARTPSADVVRVVGHDTAFYEPTGSNRGRISFTKKMIDAIGALAPKWAAGRLPWRSVPPQALSALSVVVHEEIHAHTSTTGKAYAGLGIHLEECVTEVTAQRTIRAMLGATDAKLPKKHPLYLPTDSPSLESGDPKGHGSAFAKIVGPFYRAAKEVIGKDPAWISRFEAAMIAYKSRGPGRKASSEEDAWAHFYDELGLSPDERRAFRAAFVVGLKAEGSLML
jgi:SPP1 gp7 family putative phage head morphogenesis protein